MKYLTLIILSLTLVMLICLGSKKQNEKDKGDLKFIKSTVVISILVNTCVLTGLIIGREGVKPFDIIFLWVINFVIPFCGFQRVFKE